jgi:hypothetical protein
MHLSGVAGEVQMPDTAVALGPDVRRSGRLVLR